MTRLGTLLLALCTVAGCVDDDRYFCVYDGPPSERGCFLCRDDECFSQPPPSRDMCLEEDDCAVGEICTDIGCVSQCTQDLDCPLGTGCNADQLCVSPLEDQPTMRQSPPPVPQPEPEPTPPPVSCQFNFDCGDGRICIDGECLFTCLDAPCPDTQQCMAGACRPCMEDVCLSNCASDDDCSEVEYCSDFQCVPDTRPVAFCPETECQPGRLCVRGQCRTPCDSDEECAAIDSAIRFCAPVDDMNLCVRSSEVLAECQLNIDCAFGEECVDGSCAVAPL